MRAVDPDEYLDMDDSDADDFDPIPDRVCCCLDWSQGASGGQSDVFVSKESLQNPSSGVPEPDTARHWNGTVLVLEGAMEVDFDAGVEPSLVRRVAKRANAMWEERADQTDMEVCPDTAGEYCDCDAVETLSWCATVGGIRTEQECEMFRWPHKYEKSSMQTVICTTTRAKRDEAQLRVVTHEYTDAMCVPEHYASTLSTRTLRSVISRMMSKCRTRQLESCDTLSAFFHAWLERGVQMKSTKDPRLSDGWRLQLARAFFPLSPGVSTQWMPGSARMATDAGCVENLAGLSEVKGLKSSSRVAGRGQCGVLKTSTATEILVHREGMIIALYSDQTGLTCCLQRGTSLETCRC